MVQYLNPESKGIDFYAFELDLQVRIRPSVSPYQSLDNASETRTIGYGAKCYSTFFLHSVKPFTQIYHLSHVL